MEGNRKMYLGQARKKMTNQQYVMLEQVLTKAYEQFFVPCDGYEELTHSQRMYYNAAQHALYYKVWCKSMETLVHVPDVPDDIPLSLEADVALRVSLMKERHGAGATDASLQEVPEILNEEEEVCTVVASAKVGVSKSDVAFSITQVPVSQTLKLMQDTVGFGISIASRTKDFNAYPVRINSLMRGGLTERELSNIVREGRVLVRHREFVTKLILGKDKPVNVLKLTPGLTRLMPWLDRVSRQYKYYSVRGLVFDYVPTVSSLNLGLINMCSYQGMVGGRTLSDYSTYQKKRVCVPWIHPVDMERAPKGTNYLVGMNNHGSGAGQYCYSMEGKLPDYGPVGELWVTYEVELWGSYMEVSANDTIFTCLKLMTERLGPEFMVARHLLGRVGHRWGDRISVSWINKEGMRVPDDGTSDLEIQIRDKSFPAVKCVIERLVGSSYRTVKQMAELVIASVSSRYMFEGDVVKEINLNLDQMLRCVKEHLLISIIAIKEGLPSVGLGLASVGIYGAKVTDFYKQDGAEVGFQFDRQYVRRAEELSIADYPMFINAKNLIVPNQADFDPDSSDGGDG